MDNGSWTLIESDPGVFTELISNFGVKGLEVEEVWDLEEFQNNSEKTVHGFIFLFKWEGSEKIPRQNLDWEEVPNVFFAKQVIQNACATQAILSVLMNCSESVELGEELNQFKSFTMKLDPESKGLSISNSDLLRTVHNSFARADLFSDERKQSDDDDENFHFVAYVPVEGSIYELDGLQKGPICVAHYGTSPWTSCLVPVLYERMAKYSGNEIRFCLLSIVKSKLEELQEQIQKLEAQMNQEGNSTAQKEQWNQQRTLLFTQILEENEKFNTYKKENMRRRHNFIPLVLELVKQMATHKCLTPAVKEAQEKARSRLQKASTNT